MEAVRVNSASLSGSLSVLIDPAFMSSFLQRACFLATSRLDRGRALLPFKPDYFENWLVLADSSALAESLVSFPTAKQEPSGEPEGTRASDKTLRRRRQTFVASHWRPQAYVFLMMPEKRKQDNDRQRNAQQP